MFSLFNIDCVDPNIIPDCDVFNPDRWETQKMKNLNPFSFTPFSAGPRNCIGQSMALIETKLIITNIIRKFVVHPVLDKKI